MIDFDLVADYLPDAKAIAWDTCHKIYVLLDDEQVELMRKYEYDPLITKSEMSEAEMLETLKKWFDNSCALRFIEAVKTDHRDPNAGFTTLIEQGATTDDEDEDKWCYQCGYKEADYDGLCDTCLEKEREDEDEDEDE